MKIAVSYENGNIFQHFGRTEQFKVYTVENGTVTAAETVGTNGAGHGALVGFLGSVKADVLICGGIGAGARNALAASGITLYAGNSGSADEAVAAFLAGKLLQNEDPTCDHHEHHEGHSCGSHGCGEH
ncbi:Predicted Fe-Mo cluster-binding protein, NifX family [Ruminococcaceae bacterium FB2012]|nr:Predicted Fe-Mo cluster-binding protein, NifX family [Ruminococcaceae bacterium FB2012]